jgi:ribonucleotide reductase beta subunit family protein with ferritin-like domain
MSKSVFNKDKGLDATKQLMFFGPDLAVQQYSDMKYPIFDKLNQQQLGYFWRPEEISLQKDRNDYLGLSEQQKHIFTSNLKYQTMLDSVQGRGPCLAFLPFCSLPELEGCIVTWDFIETIHSRSYTYIIKNLYPDPNEIFDTIIKDQKIENRAKTITEKYDDMINTGYQWVLDPSKVDLYELKKKLYLTMVTVNILEGLRFYVSFACSFAFGELKMLEGSAKIISFIARDESQHLAMSQTIINNWKDREGDKDMVKIAKECEKEVYQMYEEALQEEKRWATYLFSKGAMIGLSEKLLHQFVEYMANRRMKAIQLNPIYDQKTNPLPWTDHWLNSKGMQNAPQETEIESYVIGGIKQDVEKDQFKKFKL